MGHAPAAYCFPPPQQALYMAPPPLPTPGRRTTGTPKERAQSGERAEGVCRRTRKAARGKPVATKWRGLERKVID